MNETGLGIDVGGTATRWAVASANGALLARGSIAGLSSLLMGSDSGRTQLKEALGTLPDAIRSKGIAIPLRVVAGFSGYSDDEALRARIEDLVAMALGTRADKVRVVSDIALAYLGCFKPGDGYLVYAGTGSIGAYIDSNCVLHRVGGRGHLLDDAGSGYWIAREALSRIWRHEDEFPGNADKSALATALFGRIGSSTWAGTRAFVYHGTRGQVGELALAVAAAANNGDQTAKTILLNAGVELARLATVLAQRFGPRPVALAGGAAMLHPLVESSMRDTLSDAVETRLVTLHSHEMAACLAAACDPLLERIA